MEIRNVSSVGRLFILHLWVPNTDSRILSFVRNLATDKKYLQLIYFKRMLTQFIFETMSPISKYTSLRTQIFLPRKTPAAKMAGSATF